MEKCNFESRVLTVDVFDYLFVEWLIRLGLYSKSVANFSPVRYNVKSSRDAVRKIVADLIVSPHFALSDAISTSFPFRSTPEGPDFWLDVSKEWTNYLESFSHVI